MRYYLKTMNEYQDYIKVRKIAQDMESSLLKIGSEARIALDGVNPSCGSADVVGRKITMSDRLAKDLVSDVDAEFFSGAWLLRTYGKSSGVSVNPDEGRKFNAASAEQKKYVVVTEDGVVIDDFKAFIDAMIHNATNAEDKQACEHLRYYMFEMQMDKSKNKLAKMLAQPQTYNDWHNYTVINNALAAYVKDPCMLVTNAVYHQICKSGYIIGNSRNAGDEKRIAEAVNYVRVILNNVEVDEKQYPNFKKTVNALRRRNLKLQIIRFWNEPKNTLGWERRAKAADELRYRRWSKINGQAPSDENTLLWQVIIKSC